MNEFEDNLLKRAETNLAAAKILHQYRTGDDAELNIIAYHLQQSVELSIKHILQENGIDYPRTHAIEQLIQTANANNVDLHLTDYIDGHSEMFSTWESQTRYVLNFFVEDRKINAALDEVEKYIDLIKEIEPMNVELDYSDDLEL